MNTSRRMLATLCGVMVLCSTFIVSCTSSDSESPGGSLGNSAPAAKAQDTLAEITALYNSLTAEQIEQDAAQMRERLTSNGVPHTNNLANDLELRVILGSYKQSDIDPEHSPHLFSTLARMRDAHQNSAPLQRSFFQYSPQELAATDQRLPLNAVLSLGRSSGIKSEIINGQVVESFAAANQATYSSSALTSIPNGTLHSSLYLQLYDPATNNPIGQPQYIEDNNAGTNLTLSVSAAGDSSLTQIGVTMIVFYQPKPTALKNSAAAAINALPPVSQMIQQTAGIMPVQYPGITDPVHKKTQAGSAYIKVCLSRNAGADPNCDYGPFEAATANPIVQLPVTGSAQYDGSKYSFDTSRKTTGSLYVWAKQGGGGCTLTLDPAQFAAAFSAGTAAGEVKWAFKNANFGRLGNNPCWIADKLFGMSLQANIPLAGTPIPGSLFLSTAKFPNPPMDTAFVNSPLNFTWGCFAGGTMIRMADGTSKAIENITAGEKVLADAGGRTLTVRETINGTEEKPMYRFTSANGRKVFVTDLHPMVIERSGKRMVVSAKEVMKDDLLITVVNNGAEEASPQIRTEEPSPGKVFNLVLGVEGEQVSKDNTTMIANGVLTGDNTMQEEFGMAFKRPLSPEVRAMLEPWLQDARLRHAKL